MEVGMFTAEWFCDRCGAKISLMHVLPREFIEIDEFSRAQDVTNPVYPHDSLWKARVRFEYVNPAGFIAGTTTTCPRCRVELLERALEAARKDLNDGKR